MYLLAANHDSEGVAGLKKRGGLSVSDTFFGMLSGKSATTEAAIAGSPAAASSGRVEVWAEVWTEVWVEVRAEDKSCKREVSGASPVARITCGSTCGCACACRAVPDAGCGRRWPRHCFSSHSTQKVRPCDTGKPHA